MALAIDIMRGGTSAGTAKAINGSISNAISAAGTVITDATDLRASINRITTAAASSGVQLPTMLQGDSCVVHNAGANTLKVYPESSSVEINQLSAGTAMSLPVNTAALFFKTSGTTVVAFLSA